MTVRQLLNSLDSHELTEWRAFFKVRKQLIKEEQEKNDPNGSHQMGHAMKTSLTGYSK